MIRHGSGIPRFIPPDSDKKTVLPLHNPVAYTVSYGRYMRATLMPLQPHNVHHHEPYLKIRLVVVGAVFCVHGGARISHVCLFLARLAPQRPCPTATPRRWLSWFF